MADNLFAECEQIGVEVRIYRDIDSALKDLQKHAPPLDPKELAHAIEAKIVAASLEKAAASRGYSLIGERVAESISAFATEKLDTLALTFELTYRLADQSDDEAAPRLEPTLTAKGNCFYNPASKEVSDVLMNSETFRWKDATGHELMNSNAHLYGIGVFALGGLPSVAHTLKDRVIWSIGRDYLPIDRCHTDLDPNGWG